MESKCVPVLVSLDTAHFIYVGEGGANAVFRVEPSSSSSSSSGTRIAHNGASAHLPISTHKSASPANGTTQLDCRQSKYVLRLRKAVPDARTVADAHRLFESEIAPLFLSQHLLSHLLVRVDGNTLHRLNSDLRALETTQQRPPRRHGVYLSHEGFGSLMPDVQFWRGHSGITLELKPKWLVQSPDAPALARRCRTCALRLMRNQSRGCASTGLCPLGLASGLDSEIERALRTSAGAEVAMKNEKVWRQVVHDVRRSCQGGGLIALLRDAQKRLAPSSVLHEKCATANLLLAMTLRDCSLFLRVSVC